MARKLVLSEPTVIAAPRYPFGFEAQFNRFLVKMTRAIAQQFRNETLMQLNKGTIEKFQDQQIGNYAVVFNTLSKRAQRKIRKRYNPDRLSKEVQRIMRAINRANQKQFYGRIEKQIGVGIQELVAEEGLNAQTNALILETEAWVQRLFDEHLSTFSANSLRLMAEGSSFEELIEGYNEEAGKRVDHAKFIARNQIANFNGLSNKIRYQKLGITQAVWQTARNERVRPSHRDREGKTFDLDKGLYSSLDQKFLLPGVDYQCACIARPIIPGA